MPPKRASPRLAAGQNDTPGSSTQKDKGGKNKSSKNTAPPAKKKKSNEPTEGVSETMQNTQQLPVPDIQSLVTQAVRDILPSALSQALPTVMAALVPQQHNSVGNQDGVANATSQSNEDVSLNLPQPNEDVSLAAQKAASVVAQNIVGPDLIEGEKEKDISSVALPPDMHLSDDMKAKIIGNKFMKFGSLLYKDSNNERKLTLKLNGKSGSMLVDPDENCVFIKYIDQWDKAFTVYFYRYVIAHPQEANALMMYGRLIKEMAQRGFYWYQYDEQFRRLRALDPKSKPWGSIDPTLWALWATTSPRNSFASTSTQSNNGRGQMLRGGQANYGNRGYGNNGFQNNRFQSNGQSGYYSRGNGRNFANRPYNNGGMPYNRRPDAMAQQKVCFRFNKGRICQPPCNYAHKCGNCGRTDHGQLNCRA